MIPVISKINKAVDQLMGGIAVAHSVLKDTHAGYSSVYGNVESR